MQHMRQFIIAGVAASVPIASAPLYSQSAETPAPKTPRITIGVGGALSSATWIGPEGEDLGSRISFENAGVSATLPLTDKLGLRVGGAYVSKGATFDDGFFGFGFEFNFKLDYIELSALGKASTTTLGRGQGSAYALAGPTLGFKAQCTTGVSLGGLDVTFEDASEEEDGIEVEGWDDCGEFFQGTDLGVAAGIGFEWQPLGDSDDETRAALGMIGDVKELKISLELLYTLGLQSIVSAPDSDDDLDEDLKNRAFTIWLGGTLPIGG